MRPLIRVTLPWYCVYRLQCLQGGAELIQWADDNCSGRYKHEFIPTGQNAWFFDFDLEEDAVAFSTMWWIP